MIKKMQYLIFFVIFSLFANCSFDNKTGIWSGSEEEKRKVAELENAQNRVINVVKVYSSENIYAEEVSSAKSVNLNKPKTNSSWKMSNLNLQNFIGNIYLSGIENNFVVGGPSCSPVFATLDEKKEICELCEFFTMANRVLNVKICLKCKCIMALKWHLPGASCPIGKW